MKKRPLCILCLSFLIVKGIILLLVSGQTFIKVPASSIFFKNEQMENVLVRGQVYKKKNTSKIQILYLKNNSIFGENNSYYDSKILIYDDSFADVSIGQIICVKGKASRFEQARNPGNFNQSLYYARQGVYGFLWCEKIISIEGKENVFLERLHQLRLTWKEILMSNMGENMGAVLSAMLLGEKSEMEGETKELYQKNGISHVLAISGLHISFIGLGLYRMLRKMGTSYLTAGVIAIGFLSIYVFMIGFSVSVFRAYVMLLFRIGADISGRVYDMLTALMFSAAIAVAYEPLYLTDAAFYMSYGAVLGILLVLPELKKIFSKKGRWMENCLSSVAINVALFPVLLWFYFEFPIYSSAINMLILPLMAWVLGFGLFGSMAYCLWKPLGILLLKICGFILQMFEWIGEKGCQLPFSSIVLGKPERWQIVVYYMLLTVVLYFLHQCKNQRSCRKIRWSVLVFCVITLFLFVKFPNGKVQITMLDVGQGDCIYMRGPRGNTYLFDSGSSDVDRVGKYRVESFLKSQGVRSLDYVFVSHGDSDHYNGIEELIKRQLFGVEIKTVVFPTHYRLDKELQNLASLAHKNGIRVAVIDSGQKISEGNLEIRCLQPKGKSMVLEGNAGSMVLDVCFREFDMLFTGDVEGLGEELLIENLRKQSYEVLKVSHHGSKNSTLEDFLQVAKPKIALISAGENNSYGHPHTETIERLKKYGCEIYQTTKRGAITMETDGDLIDIFPSSI